MRVLLVQAFSMEESSPLKVYPLGIVTLATHLIKHGFDVSLIDMNMETDAYGALKNALLTFRPDVVGVSLRNIDPLANKTSSLVPPFLVTVRFISKILPGTSIIAGGTGYSMFPARLLGMLPELRFGLVGESENTLPVLLSQLENPPAIPGLCYRKNGNIELIPATRNFDLSLDYIPPDRSLLDPTRYLDPMSYVPAIGIETQRGCPYNCSYCVYPALQGSKIRPRDTADVVDEMVELNTRFGVDRYHFNDPAVNMRPGHLETICEEILRRGLEIKWGGFFREDTLNSENITLFEKSGCECFAFSPDGMSDGALRVLDKGITVDDIIKAANLAAGTDVVSIYHFMVNTPGEIGAGIEEGKRLLARLYKIHESKRNLGTIILNNMRIHPGTELERIALEEGVIDGNTDLLYPTYYNPRPFENLRYELEAFHMEKNICMWQSNA